MAKPDYLDSSVNIYLDPNSKQLVFTDPYDLYVERDIYFNNGQNLLTSLTAAETNLDTLESTVTTAVNDINTLESTVTTAVNDINTLESTVTTITSSISSIESDIANIQSGGTSVSKIINFSIFWGK